jgi:hypothetical protein
MSDARTGDLDALPAGEAIVEVALAPGRKTRGTLD